MTARVSIYGSLVPGISTNSSFYYKGRGASIVCVLPLLLSSNHVDVNASQPGFEDGETAVMVVVLLKDWNLVTNHLLW
jgi:hypothetical protein